jgi:HK97 family phage major capsid protein
VARAFVPFSIEVGQDWGSLQEELTKLVADARDVLDAAIFYNGTGTDQPFGVRTGLTVTQRVQTAGAGAFAYGDVYTLKQAIRPRDIANAT